MHDFQQKCFATDILADTELDAILKALCSDLDGAGDNDILAVEFPYVTQNGEMDSGGFPSRVLVRKKTPFAHTLKLPWYTLAATGLDAARTQLIAQAFSRMSHHWCLNLSEQLSAMATPGHEGCEAFGLFLAPGFGALIRDYSDDSEGFDPDIHASFQDYIDRHSAVAVPPCTSSHEKLTTSALAQRGATLVNMAAPIWNPENFAQVYPKPYLA